MKISDLPEHMQKRIKSFKADEFGRISDIEFYAEYPTVVRAAPPGPTPPDPWNRKPWLLPQTNLLRADL